MRTFEENRLYIVIKANYAFKMKLRILFEKNNSTIHLR